MSLLYDLTTSYNSKEQKRFFLPSQITFQNGAIKKLPELVTRFKKSILFVDQYFEHADFIQCKTSELVVVRGEPTSELVESTYKRFGKHVDALFAIGGGSTMDTAKAFKALVLYGVYDGLGYESKVNLPVHVPVVPPLICFPTTAGTGAETSKYLVVYDSQTKQKKIGRSWDLCANEVILDPSLLISLPASNLVLCAFDAFVHYFETLVCRYERSLPNEMLSVFGIQQIVETLQNYSKTLKYTNVIGEKLLWASCLSGVAISNVRTGNIHEAAGALLEESTLAHPETLFVFFKQAVVQYQGFIREQEAKLSQALKGVGIENLNDLISFWGKIFFQVGATTQIKKKIQQIPLENRDKIYQKILARVTKDLVWMTKESPCPYSRDQAESFIQAALDGWDFFGKQ